MRCLLKSIYWMALAAVIVTAALASLYLHRRNSLHDLIVAKAERYELDPRLALALVQACSRCQPSWSAADQYGLLALSQNDLIAWNRQQGVARELFDLFDPEANLDVGFDKYARMRVTWQRQRNPDAWALAEWFAGAEKTREWAARAATNESVTAGVDDNRLRAKIDGILGHVRPGTLKLVWPGSAPTAR